MFVGVYLRFFYFLGGVALKNIYAVGLGSALGGIVRYLLDLFFLSYGSLQPEFSLLLINILGSYLLGFGLFYYSIKLKNTSQFLMHFWGMGFCGGFTTFASFIYILSEAVLSEDIYIALIYASISVFGGLAAFIIGILSAKAI